MLRFFHAFAAIFRDDFWALVRFATWDPPTAPPVPWAMTHRDMSATALNDRCGAGMRCRGFLGKLTAQMLG